MENFETPEPLDAQGLIAAINDDRVKQFIIIAESLEGDINWCVAIPDSEGANRDLMEVELQALPESYRLVQSED